jgi:hypothetical protein
LSGGIITSSDATTPELANLLFLVDQKLTEARTKGPNVLVK